jgi:hypothetical protein
MPSNIIVSISDFQRQKKLAALQRERVAFVNTKFLFRVRFFSSSSSGYLEPESIQGATGYIFCFVLYANGLQFVDFFNHASVLIHFFP